ncbi:MAG: TIGR04255 family protein [Proteobacteria bacterium]|nr:TIGR04255 family protein [Pseudomonadota bacterium]
MLNIKHHARKAFSKHFIRQAFIELRYSKIEVDWKNIKIRLDKDNPFLTFDKLNLAFAANISLEKPSVSSDKIKVAKYSNSLIGIDLQSDDKSLIAQLRDDRIIFTCNEYTSFENFWSICSDFVTLAKTILFFNDFLWFGVRKINVVGVDVDNGTYRGEGFSEEFFEPVRIGRFEEGFLKSGENNYLVKKDDTSCIIKLAFMQLMDKDKYEICFDIDVNKQLPQPLSFHGLKEEADNLNQMLFDVFCWVIARDLREKLEEVT